MYSPVSLRMGHLHHLPAQHPATLLPLFGPEIEALDLWGRVLHHYGRYFPQLRSRQNISCLGRQSTYQNLTLKKTFLF